MKTVVSFFLLCSVASADLMFVGAGDEASFQSTISAPGVSHDWIIQPDAVLTGLNISGRQGDTFTFQPGTSLIGNVQTQDNWQADRGVVNILDSNVLIAGLKATNAYTFLNDGNHQHQASTVLNVQRSTANFTGSTFTSNGKSAVWINSGSNVGFDFVQVHGHYFTTGVIGSNFTANDSTFHSFNPTEAGDKHSALWAGAAMTDLGVDYKGATLGFTNSLFDMDTGTAIVSGNGNDLDYRATVTLDNTELDFSTNDGIRPVGVLDYHENYHGITVNMVGDYDQADVLMSGPLPNTDYGWLIDSRGTTGIPLSALEVCFPDGTCAVGSVDGIQYQVAAVPEPSSFLLMGLIALLAIGYRKYHA